MLLVVVGLVICDLMLDRLACGRMLVFGLLGVVVVLAWWILWCRWLYRALISYSRTEILVTLRSSDELTERWCFLGFVDVSALNL